MRRSELRKYLGMLSKTYVLRNIFHFEYFFKMLCRSISGTPSFKNAADNNSTDLIELYKITSNIAQKTYCNICILKEILVEEY